MRNTILLFILCLSLIACQSSKKTAAKETTTTSTTHTATLANTWWQLTEANGKPTVTPPDGRETYIKLLDGNKLEGYTGCNSLAGNYSTSANNTIHFTPASTKMACEDMSNETFLLNALRNANKYKIKDGLLYLYKDKEQLAFLKAMFF